MLAQYDAMILADMPFSDSIGQPKQPVGLTGLSSEVLGAEEVERLSRLEILLEPLNQVLRAIIPWLGTGKSLDRKAPSIAP